MKIVFKVLVVTGLAVGISNYFIYLKTGRMPVQEWVQSIDLSPNNLVEGAKNMGKGAIDQVKPSEPAKVYKWTDENGVVHYGERPANEAAEEMIIDTARNIIPAPTRVTAHDSTGGIENVDSAMDQQAPLEKARAAAEAMKARIETQESY